MWNWLKNKLIGERESVLMLVLALFHKDTPLKIRLLLILAIGYLVSPFDILPDGIVGVGLIDDLIIVPAILYVSQKLLPSKVEHDLIRTKTKIHKYIPFIIAAIVLAFLLWIGLCIYIIYKLIF